MSWKKPSLSLVRRTCTKLISKATLETERFCNNFPNLQDRIKKTDETQEATLTSHPATTTAAQRSNASSIHK